MIDEPTTVPGPRLKEQRQGYGVSRQALADHMHLHRNTLREWEKAHALDVIRTRRYVAALTELIEQAAA